jgi:putative FmdB family regulatory protein
MPRYTYHCEDCDSYCEITHAMGERIETLCLGCEGALNKVPSMPLSLVVKKNDARTGEVVKSSIEEFKKDLKEQRSEASKKEI